MAALVLDSWALMAFFKDEASAETVEHLLEQTVAGRHQLLLSVVNWGEIYYSIMRADGRDLAEQKTQEIAALPIEIVSVDSDLVLVRQAAQFKALHKMSYADAFAAALAKTRRAELITGDHEFEALGKDIKVRWLDS
jgi:uncharacterized protein